MLPTLRTVMSLSSVRRGDPEVEAGAAGLDRMVRWVHVSEVRDGASLLEGGELVLSTGLALAADPGDAASYVRELSDAGASGLMIELSAGFPSVPRSALRMAEGRDFPLLVLRRSTRFVTITEEINRAIVGDRLEQVTFAQHVHEVFTLLTLDESTPHDVVQSVASLAESSVVLEDLRHHVIAHVSVDQTDGELLRGWAARSRATHSTSNGDHSWIVESVGRRGQEWARLIIPRPTTSRERVSMVLERAAQALELGRMIERDRLTLELQAQGGFLRDLMDGAIDNARDAEARAHSLGLARAPRYVPVVVKVALAGDPGSLGTHRQSRRLIDRITQSARDARASALIGPLGLGSVGMLVAVPFGRQERTVLESLSAAIAGRSDEGTVWIGVDDSVTDVFAAAAGMERAQHVAAVAATTLAEPKPYFRHTDVRLRGLLSLIHEDPRVQAFAEAELQRILVHDAAFGDHLLQALRSFLDAGGNKTEMARQSHRSRPSLYKTLDRIQNILGVSLDDPASRTSLTVAMMAHDLDQALRRTR